MKARGWAAAAPVVLIAAGGCLASKSDISLLQDEMRATRSQLAQGDTSILRAEEARRAQIAALTTKIDHMNDSLRVLAVRLASFQATSNGEFDAVGQQMVQMQALLGQTTRNLQDTRAQLSAIREQGGMPSGGPPALVSMDTSQRGGAGQPGASTLFLTAKDQLDNGAYSTARAGFERLLATYPASDQAPRALLYVGEAFKAEGNSGAADSVYQLIPVRYPNTPEAATGMYRHGRTLWDANKKSEARVVLNRVIRDYPNSDAAELARELLNPRQ
jgi:tol-pal system protein YbgF